MMGFLTGNISIPHMFNSLSPSLSLSGLLCLYAAVLISAEWFWNWDNAAEDSTTDKLAVTCKSCDSHVISLLRRVITVIAFFEAMTFGLFVLAVGSGQVK